MNRWLYIARLCLYRLCSTYLATIFGHRAIQCHILWLKWGNLYPSPSENPA
ncbi:hypothetical protein VA249_33820 [Vibrio alfacsensis]|nr:hypothetical protein VA249_33820 [Vibrio alfacsensis]